MKNPFKAAWDWSGDRLNDIGDAWNSGVKKAGDAWNSGVKWTGDPMGLKAKAAEFEAYKEMVKFEAVASPGASTDKGFFKKLFGFKSEAEEEIFQANRKVHREFKAFKESGNVVVKSMAGAAQSITGAFDEARATAASLEPAATAMWGADKFASQIFRVASEFSEAASIAEINRDAGIEKVNGVVARMSVEGSIAKLQNIDNLSEAQAMATIEALGDSNEVASAQLRMANIDGNVSALEAVTITATCGHGLELKNEVSSSALDSAIDIVNALGLKLDGYILQGLSKSIQHASDGLAVSQGLEATSPTSDVSEPAAKAAPAVAPVHDKVTP